MAQAIRIRVGAAVDPSLRTVFKSFEESADRAARKARTSLNTGQQQAAKEQRAQLLRSVAANKAYSEALKAIDRSRAQDESRQRQASTRAALRDFDQRLRASKKAHDAEERDIIRAAKTAERVTQRRRAMNDRENSRQVRRGERFRESAARGFANHAASGIASAARGAVGIGRDVAGGLGIDTSLAGGVARATNLESTATDIINSAAAAGKIEATRENVKALERDIKAAANATKVGFGDMGAGVSDFVTKSADIDLARKSMADIAKIAQATGTNVNDALSMSGDIARSLPDNEKDALLPLVRLFAKQGSMGNLELPQMAKYGGRLVSTAFQYEGTREENMGRLGAMAQVSMRGGRSSGAEATRAAASFARDITKDAAGKRLKDAGIQVYTDKSKKKIRNQEDIIVDVFLKTNGSQAKLAKLFQNEMSKSIMLGFGDIYDQAGGGEKGIQAIRDEFKKFTETMTGDQVETAWQLKANTDAAKAQEFQNRLDEVSASLVEKLVPSLEKASPALIRMAETAANWTAAAVENPYKAAAAIVGAQIAAAGIGEVVKMGVIKALSGAGGTIGAITVAAGVAYIAGREYIDDAIETQERAEQSADDSLTAGQVAMTNARTGKNSAKDKAKALEDALAENERQLAFAKSREDSSYSLGVGGLRYDPSAALGAMTFGLLGKDDTQIAGESAASKRESELREQNAALKAELAGIKSALSGNLQVTVTNAADIRGGGGGGVDQSGRVGSLINWFGGGQ